jgi:cardiolipin synthase
MLRQLKSAPNQLTLLRLVFVPLIAVAVVDGRWQWAMALFLLAGISDGLDGMLARMMKQQTVLGRYLDPIADKMLLSTMFLVLASVHKVPWRITILVFSRDLGILLVSLLLYMTTSLRDFSPSILGKANTGAQIITLLLVLMNELTDAAWVRSAKLSGLWVVAALTLLSAVHYVWLVGQRLRAPSQSTPQIPAA